MVADELLTVPEVAGILKYHQKTVERWCREGKIASSKSGKYYRIRRSDLDDFVKRGEAK